MYQQSSSFGDYNNNGIICDCYYNYGILLKEHLNDYKRAIYMFEVCLKINLTDQDAENGLLSNQTKPHTYSFIYIHFLHFHNTFLNFYRITKIIKRTTTTTK